MWILTVHKRNVGSRDGLTRIPIVRLMMRDGAWIFVAVCCKHDTLSHTIRTLTYHFFKL